MPYAEDTNSIADAETLIVGKYTLTCVNAKETTSGKYFKILWKVEDQQVTSPTGTVMQNKGVLVTDMLLKDPDGSKQTVVNMNLIKIKKLKEVVGQPEMPTSQFLANLPSLLIDKKITGTIKTKTDPNGVYPDANSLASFKSANTNPF